MAEKLPTLPFEYQFALSMLRTKGKFHNLLPVLEPEKRKFITTCIAFSLQHYGYLQVYSDTYKPDEGWYGQP